MAALSGTEISVALCKGTTWGTAAALGANHGIYVLSANLKRDSTPVTDESLGLPFSTGAIPGPIKVEGDISANLRYDSLHLPFALCMGTTGAPSSLGNGAYSYNYKIKKLLDGIFGAFGKNMKAYIEEHPSVKFSGFTLKGETGKPLDVVFKTISFNKVVDSTTNTTGTFANVTVFEKENLVRFSQGVIRMNNQTAGALSSGDIIYPGSFEVNFNRKLKGEYSSKYLTATAQELIDEPLDDGPMEVTLKIDFSRHTGSAYIADLNNNTYKKMDMIFTGNLIGGANYRQFYLRFPNLQLLNDNPTDAKGNIKEPLEFKAHGCLTAPTGMSGLTDPFDLGGVNRWSTDPLA